ncbi:DUF1761 family protein [Streptomyces sp. AC495_CC817]|uniref:DUF1761 family protein n=1 Tax=Streptomyces sp. AC495_CC817 TaxID=2823900 RepID=UPI001C273FBB|nr:DUF1761 family protein [Streptomyces sp. AC495_CC817]
MLTIGILIATVVSFAASAVLYALPPVGALITRTSTPRPGVPVAVQMGSVVVRSLLAALLVAGLMAAAGWHGAGAGALLGLGLSVMPLILLFGGVVHEGTAIPTACVHLLDWVIKLTATGAIVGLFL